MQKVNPDLSNEKFLNTPDNILVNIRKQQKIILEATKMIKGLKAELEAGGEKEPKVSNRETFPVDTRININTAGARQIADALPGVGLKTARDIKDLQTTLSGERFTKLEQLRGIKRIDWDEIFKENLVRVD